MSTKDQGDVTIISSNSDGFKIKWMINNLHALDVLIVENIILSKISNPNWLHCGIVIGNRVSSDDIKVSLNFEPMEIELWALKGLKTKSCLTATFKSSNGKGDNSFNSEEGTTPKGGYELFSLTAIQIGFGFDMEFNWSISLEKNKWFPDIPKKFFSITDDFGKMLENTKGHDMTIRCIGVEMTAHKIILAGRSPVFQAMFQSDMKEAKESLVEINEVSPDSIQAMLRWIYTCQIDGKYKDFALDLIRLAHMYEMPLLMEECEAILISQIKKENVTDILVVADMVEAKEVKKTAISFIIGDKSITEMDGFQDKVSKQLLVEIINAHK